MLRNLELKARLADLDAARQMAGALATRHLGLQRQVDTYFYCHQGRLKLRQIDGLIAQLVWYARPDLQGPKPSDYLVVPVANPETLKRALQAALGIRGVVRKRREVYLVQNVRIHLDEVDDLGRFLEFEAVLGPSMDDHAARELLEELIRHFGLSPECFIAGSYADMLFGGETVGSPRLEGDSGFLPC